MLINLNKFSQNESTCQISKSIHLASHFDCVFRKRWEYNHFPCTWSCSKYFGVDEASSQALLSAYYLPMAIFPLVFGSLSDRYGRRPPLIFGLALLTTGGLTATLSESFELLVFARVIQGIGAAAAGTILIPMIKDSYNNLEAARILAIVSSIMMIVPFFSFAFGGIITEIFS